jgi:hypothetical protein
MHLQLVRPEALPEGVRYTDGGCTLAPSCLRCPFPECRYDRSQGRRSLLATEQAARAHDLRRKGYTLAQIMLRLQVSRRTAYRWLGRCPDTVRGP